MNEITGYERTFDVFRQFPEGLTSFELIDLLDDEGDKASATSRLSQFVKEGLAEKAGSRPCIKTNRIGAVYVPNGKPFAERIPHPHGPKPFPKSALNDELKELRAFKADAIKRFPELLISPKIIRARKVWADALRSEGQIGKASIVDSGGLDDTEQMRVLIHALGGVK
jgi:hypothetical protein